jgi:hypothetical protein
VVARLDGGMKKTSRNKEKKVVIFNSATFSRKAGAETSFAIKV